MQYKTNRLWGYLLSLLLMSFCGVTIVYADPPPVIVWGIGDVGNSSGTIVLGGSNQQVVSCFPAGTGVTLGNRKIKKIEDVVAGDVVLSQNEDGKLVSSTVSNIEKPVRDEMCRIDFKGGDKLELTSEHPVMTNNGWSSINPGKTKLEKGAPKVNELKIGDWLQKENGGYAEVSNVSCRNEKVQTYNLILGGDVHTYFADGYLVHNKYQIYVPPGAPPGFTVEVQTWTCFAAGTKVDMASGTKSNIEDVKVGDEVVSQSESGERSVSTVTALDQPVREHMCKLDFSNGSTVKLTEEHPLMTTEGWKALDPNKTKNENPELKVGKLETGDTVVRDDGTKAVLQNISCWSEKTQAYNLILGNGAHTYFADGFLAHNKGGGACEAPPLPDCPAGTYPTDEVVSSSCVNRYSFCGIGSMYKVLEGCDCELKHCGKDCEFTACYGWYIQAHHCEPYCGVTIDGVCKECGPTISPWSACDPNTHKRTRACGVFCAQNVSLCDPYTLEEDCTVDVKGTLFDATNMNACPSFDPATGYLVGVDTTLTANNRTFGLADQKNSPATHPWPLITPTVATTNSVGNYSVRVYSPTTYNYDFTSLKDIYVVSEGPKLTCTSSSVVAPASDPTCMTQPCSKVNNISFGFNRYWGGWWQTVGAGVHGEKGIKSSIPSTYPSEQSLILRDPAIGNRDGVLSYGTLTDFMLGVNPNAKVSNNLWQIKSSYDGVIYDYNFFNQQFKKYVTTAWDGTSPLVYDDKGKGYQIFKVTGSIADFNYSPVGTQKVIFLVNGDVNIGANLTIPDGAFMAILASGDITFKTTVTKAEGWYLGRNIFVRCTDANSDLECDRTDSQFLGNGSFVGWKGIYLKRDMGGANNILNPAQKFTYRLDLYNNAPEPLKNVTKMYKPYVP